MTRKGCNIDWKEYYFQKKSILKSKAIKYESVRATNVPTPRMAHSGAIYKDKIVYIGGQEADTSRFDQVITFDPSS